MTDGEIMPVQTVEADGKMSRSRFANADSMWDAYKRLYDEDLARSKNRAKVQGMIDGNPPRNQETLVRDGQAWQSNFNPREAEAIRSSLSSSYWSLMFMVEHLLDLKPTIKPNSPTEQRILQDDCKKIANEFTKTMHQWDDFLNNMIQVTNDMVTYGVGYCGWFDEFDFRFSAVQHGGVKIPPRVKSRISAQKIYFVEDGISPSDFLAYLDNDKADAYGWNTKAIKEMLIRRYAPKKDTNNNDIKYDKTEFESWQQQVKNNDFGHDFGDMEDVQVVHCFVSDPDGSSVSHYILENISSATAAGSTRDYLLKREGKRKSLSECVCPMFFDVGDGYVRSIKGAVQKCYPQLEVSARMLNATVDASILMGSVMCTDNGSPDRRMLRIGPITFLPQGLMPLQTNFAPRMEGMIATRSMMSGLMESNAGVYNATTEQMDRRSTEKSAEQVKVEAEKEARLSTFQTMIFYTHLDRLYRECLRRMLTSTPASAKGHDEAAAFKKRLQDLNVDPRLLNPKNLMCRAMRTSGYGSTTMARMISERIAANAKEGLYDQAGVKQAVRDMTAQLAGWDMVDRYAPDEQRDQIPTNETSIATLENNSIAKGEPVVVGADQNHVLHAEAVFSLLEPIAQEYVKNAQQSAGKEGQQFDSRRIIPAFQAGIPHLVQHVVEASRSPANRGWTEQADSRVKQLQKAAGKMLSDANRTSVQEFEARREAALRQQEAAAQMSPEAMNEQRKNAVTQADIQRKDAVAAAEIQRKQAKADVDMRVKAAKAGQNMTHANMNMNMKRQEMQGQMQPSIPEYTGEGEVGI
jgi:hypothetical protein